VAEAGNIKDSKGEPKNIKESLIVDSLATAFSGLLGTSSGTCYIESATGIEQGGRTGLTAVTCGLLFLPFIYGGISHSLIYCILSIGPFQLKCTDRHFHFGRPGPV
jgi:Permeases